MEKLLFIMDTLLFMSGRLLGEVSDIGIWLRKKK